MGNSDDRGRNLGRMARDRVSRSSLAYIWTGLGLVVCDEMGFEED